VAYHAEAALNVASVRECVGLNGKHLEFACARRDVSEKFAMLQAFLHEAIERLTVDCSATAAEIKRERSIGIAADNFNEVGH
jgi:hypothetical protein